MANNQINELNVIINSKDDYVKQINEEYNDKITSHLKIIEDLKSDLLNSTNSNDLLISQINDKDNYISTLKNTLSDATKDASCS